MTIMKPLFVFGSLLCIHMSACYASELMCPSVDPDVVGTCVDSCSSHQDCSNGTLCCSNGCGHTCQTGVPNPCHSHVCGAGTTCLLRSVHCLSAPCNPVPACIDQERVCPDDVISTCTNNTSTCASHTDCLERELCCQDGCKKSCLLSVKFSESGCPVPFPDQVGTCATECEHHTDCPSSKLCCTNGCAHTCQQGKNTNKGSKLAGMSPFAILTLVAFCNILMSLPGNSMRQIHLISTYFSHF